jgi:hypothetical protein
MGAMHEKAIVPDNLKAAIELSVWLLLVAGATVLVTLGVLSLEGCIWVATLLMLCVFIAAWKGFDGGRHPCFLFLGMLLIFQFGRLIAHIFGVFPDPMQIDLATPVPFQVSTAAAEMTLLILVLSAICIYAPCRFGYRSEIFRQGGEVRWLQALYVLILITFPFALYKNWAYFSFIRAHGGYLAVYTENAGILQSAGAAVRSIALVNSAALLTAYVFERKSKRIRWILILYITLSTLDLLIGFRGKFFSQALGLWYIHKLKLGSRFNLVPLLGTAVAVSLLAVVVAGFRENQSVQLLNPLGFLALQGNSLNVTEAAVAFHQFFGRFGANYVWYGFVYDVIGAPVELHHQLWTNDLTNFLNPAATEMGLGTASAYIAELYLLGGTLAVILGSFAIGITLKALHRASQYNWGAVLTAFALSSLIYLPRLEFFGPVAAVVRAMIGFVPVVAFVILYGWAKSFMRLVVHRRIQGDEIQGSATQEGVSQSL